METAGEHISLWNATAPGTDYPALEGEVTVDVAVLGGGIAGLTTATLLKRAGKQVALLEAGRIVQGVTGNTTAKVTANHLLYAELAAKYGEEGARLYGQANLAALERLAQLVAEDNIDCEFERKDSFYYAESAADLPAVEDEVAAARRAGLPANLALETGLPFAVAGAVRFANQAQFHPRKYLLHVAERLPDDDSFLFEQSRALEVTEGEPCLVTTANGRVRARDVVVATHFPILNRGFFFARVHPYREYALAVRVEESQDPRGMFNSVASPNRSLRTARDGEGLLLIVGGEIHRPGTEARPEERYRRLEAFARERFGVTQVAYRWSTQDNHSVDSVPYIGKMVPWSEHVYLATGFGAWGMTNGTLAGMIISDLILGRANPWAAFFDPRRVNLGASARALAAENATVARHFFGDRLAPGQGTAATLAAGEGALVEDEDGVKVAVYRDDAGALHALSPRCSHLGCLVQWNAAEKSWDCPCHGSRFSATGQVIHGPATRDLKRDKVRGD
ncbi:MAG: FAD-dependent oxidoreductase [Chloroflexota bacterium]